MYNSQCTTVSIKELCMIAGPRCLYADQKFKTFVAFSASIPTETWGCARCLHGGYCNPDSKQHVAIIY